MKIKCIVAAINAGGEPDLFFVIVECTQEQYDEGKHYDAARYECSEHGYDACLAFDENDSAGKAMLPLFDWDTASTVTIPKGIADAIPT